MYFINESLSKRHFMYDNVIAFSLLCSIPPRKKEKKREGIIWNFVIKRHIKKFIFNSTNWRKSEYRKGFNEKKRTKTSIRYAKENDREKRERKKGRRRDIEWEEEIRECERERVKSS